MWAVTDRLRDNLALLFMPVVVGGAQRAAAQWRGRARPQLCTVAMAQGRQHLEPDQRKHARTDTTTPRQASGALHDTQ